MSKSSPVAKAVFEKAVALTMPEERLAYLKGAIAQTPEIQLEVEALLKAYDQVGNLLEGIPTADVSTQMLPNDPRPRHEASGDQIGPYKLIEMVGEGGMGSIWMAEQNEPVKRIVALKLIKAGMDSAKVLARFDAERQALALMDHPNIAKVFDGGMTTDGRPYFVMEMVRGTRITKFCDERKLSLRDRLELFIPVCQAIQHAHQKGIIHRDIKPSNVLVTLSDDKPIPKVIDFGIAKASGQQLTDQTLHTEIGAMIGTPEYMSPEQAGLFQLDVDTRSDIYSLGALLYELLTGAPPFSRNELKTAGMLEIVRLIREQEPPKPSTRLSGSGSLPSVALQRQIDPQRLTSTLCGELDWIVMKALEKDRNRRYETANGFAADVRRYLEGEPVLAVPPSLGYRMRKFLNRNRGPAIAATVVVFALLAGITGVTMGLLEATRQRDRANEARAAESAARIRADAALVAEEAARVRAVDEAKRANASESDTRTILEFVEERVFAAARPEGMDGGLGRDVTLLHAVDDALLYVTNSFHDRPHIEARLRRTMAQTFVYLGEAATASEHFKAAREIWIRERGPEDSDALRCDVGLADCEVLLGHQEEAGRIYVKTIAMMKQRLGPEHPDTLRANMGLAYNLGARRRHAEALALRESVLAVQRRILGPTHLDTIRNRLGMLIHLTVLGRREDAANQGNELIATIEAEYGKGHPDAIRCMVSISYTYEMQDKRTEALKLREEALVLQKAKLGVDHPNTLSNMEQIAYTFHKVGRWKDALKLREELIPLAAGKLGARNYLTLLAKNNLAAILLLSPDPEMHDAPRALKLAEEAVAGSGSMSWHKDAIGTLGIAHYRNGEWKKAILQLEKAITQYDADRALNGFFLAMSHWQLGEKANAQEWYQNAWASMGSGKGKGLSVVDRARAEAAALLEIEKKN